MASKQKYVFPMKLDVYNKDDKLAFSWKIDIVAENRTEAVKEFERVMDCSCEDIINDVDRVIVPYKENHEH